MACKWWTYKGQYIRHHPLSVPYSAFFEAVQNVKFEKDKWLIYPGRPCMTNASLWEDA